MQFENPSELNDLAWQMRQSDWDRDMNRARIAKIANGVPPFSAEEVETNNINVNANFLEMTRLCHDARMQAQQGILKPGNYFTASTDAGPSHKRQRWGQTMTRLVNRPMKRSLSYYENLRSKIGNNVLHGIAPSCWENDDKWCPDPLGVEDLLIPANTYLTFKNLPFFCILRSFTAPELIKLTRGTADKAWNRTLVDQCLEWIDKETMALRGSNYPEIWSPTKTQERIKGDGGIYFGDQVPTIDVLDFYYWSDQGKEEGWRRRMVLDDWAAPSQIGGSYRFGRNNKVDFAKNQWLYNPEDRVVADKREHIFNCTFADLSAVAPFRYHSVRSLGFLLYSVCHLQNRLRCKFTEAVFESLLMYFRVKSGDDAERVIKLQLANRGFLDESVDFIKAADRYQVNANLVELGLRENAQLIESNASSWTQSQVGGRDRTEKTKFQVMAEVQSATTLVSSALQQFFTYQTREYEEIHRRFLNPRSQDPDVLMVRAQLLKEIPEKYLVPQAWDIDAERTLGSGNATLEMAKAQQLMEWRPLYDPESQRAILRSATLAVTDDAALSDALVPDQPHISDSIHDTELAFGSLMSGAMVTPRNGLNSVEVVAKMLQLCDAKIKQIGPVGTPQDLIGLQMCFQYTQGFLQLLAQDKEQKGTAKSMAQILSQLGNLVKAMAQRQQEQAQKQNGGMSAEDKAKIQAIMLAAQAKAANARESHSQKTAQRQISFETKLRQDQQRAQFELQKDAAQAQIELSKQRLKTVQE